ncbi:calcium-binding protein [Sulfitobacter sp. JB4-11]|uniref:calcium-binding protein n=1 Tax=Sulfitobacter rhodophyticola TaxID=3238304 RepID=UPI00351582BA
MLAILGLLGVGLAMAAFVGSDSDDGGAGSEADTFSDEDDAIVDEAFRADVQANFIDLVGEGELTQSEADAGLAAINFTSGPQNIDTGAGDDAVLLRAGDNMIVTGDGEDVVFAGSGDDTIMLGADDDVSGLSPLSFDRGDDLVSFPTIEETGSLSAGVSEEVFEGGDDRIVGGTGDDLISDSFGANVVIGNQGDDIIDTVDNPEDQGTPDRVLGGFGQDIILVDEGDTVETGRGLDEVTVDLFTGVEAGYDIVTISDFMRGMDVLELAGSEALLQTPTPDGPDDIVENPITVEPLEDGSGSMVFVNDIPVVRVIGPIDLTVADIRLSS